MPVQRPDSIFSEWLFSPEEDIQSRILPELVILRLNTMYAELLKAQANSMIPHDSLEDRAFLMSVMENSGKMALITQLFRDHKEALESRVNQAAEFAPQPTSVFESAETRAASQVHSQNSNI